MMWGKPMRGRKSRWYPAIGATFATLLCLVSVWVVFARFTAKAPVSSALDPSSAIANTETAKATDRQPTVPTPDPIATPTPGLESATGKQRAATVNLRQGVLRVSNPSDHPVRVALLAKKGGLNLESSSNKAEETPAYDIPAHWDFAPEEGSTKGLLVSLPDRTLKLKKGDVLVAFAQDGSGRYWGPYVVGETPFPVWSAKTAEWQLTLQP